MLSIRVVKDIIKTLKSAVSVLYCFLYAFYILIQDTSHCLASVYVTGQIQLSVLLWKQIDYLRASLCKILISSFAHKMDFAHNFSVDFF